MSLHWPHPEPLVRLHPSNPVLTACGNVGEEEEEEGEEEEHVQAEEEVEKGATRFIQEFEAPLQKKAMRNATPHNKLLLVLTVKDARDMYSRDATATFREQMRLKGNKLYGVYAREDTIMISSEDDDDVESGKRLMEEPNSPRVIANNIPVHARDPDS